MKAILSFLQKDREDMAGLIYMLVIERAMVHGLSHKIWDLKLIKNIMKGFPVYLLMENICFLQDRMVKTIEISIGSMLKSSKN